MASRVRARAAVAPRDSDDVALDALTVLVRLPRNLLGGRKQAVGPVRLAADPDDDGALGVGVELGELLAEPLLDTTHACCEDGTGITVGCFQCSAHDLVGLQQI